MVEIILDKEKVVFEGPAPATVGELLDLLEHALGERGRVLAAVSIDGAGFDDSWIGRSLDELAQIEIGSATVAEALASLAGTTAAKLDEVRVAADTLARDVLRVSWNEAGRLCAEFGQRLGASVQDASQVAAHTGEQGELAAAVQGLLREVDSWIDAVKARDAAVVCLRLDQGVLPSLDRTALSLRALGEQLPT